MRRYIRRLEEVGIDDISLVGGKNASLGEMINNLSPLGISIPDGFCITAEAYDLLLEEGSIREDLEKLLAKVDTHDTDSLSRVAGQCRGLVKEAGIPDAVREQIIAAYDEMVKEHGTAPDVAVRSSATAEDLPDASFAGQQESFLNISGTQALLDACLNCFASLFTDRAISYREDKNFNHMSVKLSICVQRMVRADTGCAGVIFTLDTESGFENIVLITSAWGLGENVVAGRVDPDEFVVFKPTLEKGYKPIIKKRLGSKQVRMIYSGHGTRTTRNIEVPPEDRMRFSLDESDIVLLAEWACKIENYYSRVHGRPTPMDIEWAKDGRTGSMHIVQARPETVHSKERSQSHIIESYRIDTPDKALLTGRSIGSRVGTGKTRIIRNLNELACFQEGEVLVAEMTDPDWEPIMKKAAAIVTNRGGRTCHAAIVSREIGVPCIVGTEHGTETLACGQEITVCCALGDTGSVFDGILPFEKEYLDLTNLPETRTKIMVNLGNPDQAFSLANLPVAGVGLAREEFIITNEVKIHPLAITRFDELRDENIKASIERITRYYDSKEAYYIEKLSEGIACIAAAFYPKPVIVRMSDFKTNEYKNLLGGEQFEPIEDNPMLGYRGASRYVDPTFSSAFAMECKALRIIRDEMGLTNVIIMVPFCRTINEAGAVIESMKENGLERGKNDLEIYMMCEIPSNVLLIDKFAHFFDGFSIGSNDLTQLVLGVDRDSEILATSFDERNEAVMMAIELAIAGAQKAGRKIGICGQAPSDYPEFADFLVDLGIDSMSLSEDVLLTTIVRVAARENMHTKSLVL